MATFAAPLLLAGAAYMDARFQLLQDLNWIYTLAAAEVSIALKAKRNRLNLFYTLESHALSSSSASRPFLLYQGQKWTYREVYDIVLKYGSWIRQKHGVVKGEVVAMDFMNGPQFVFIWFGIWMLGATPAFLNYNVNGDSLLHAIKTSGAKLLLIEEEVSRMLYPDTLAALTRNGADTGGEPPKTVITHLEVELEIIATRGVREPNSARDGVTPQDMAILIFTSGTTGLPKAAIVSWYKTLRSSLFLSRVIGFKAADRYYTPMPLYHSTAALLCCCCTLVTGSSFIIGRRFSTRTFWNDVRQHDATIIQYVGETCRYLLNATPQFDAKTGEDLDRKHNVRLAFGNGLRPDVWERFKQRFGIETIAEFYGATESPIGLWNMSSNGFSSGSVGRAGGLVSMSMKAKMAFVEVDWATEGPLRDPANNFFCKKVKSGEPGELIYAVDPKDVTMHFQGYYGNQKATESKIIYDVFKKGDAYFRSGDTLRWDSEGRIFFVDRIGDTYRWKSENISTSEVAEAFGTIPQIIETNVYGVQLPFHDGRAGCAAIQLNSALTAKDADIVIRDAAKHISHRLQRHAVPLFLRVVSEMDRTGTNKQTKAILRDAGVDPKKLGPNETLLWLRDGAYVPFKDRDWKGLHTARVRL